MKGAARLVVDRSGATEMYSETPFAIRRSADRFVVVGSAAAPVGGDELALSIEVGGGASAHVCTAAATMLWPAPTGTVASTMTTRLIVRENSHLSWLPEPSVSVAGSHHVASTSVSLATGASCILIEEVALGRHAEPPGFLDATLRIERNAAVLVHHAEQYGLGSAGWGNAVGTDGARHVLTAVIVGLCDAGAPRTEVGGLVSAAWLPVAHDAAVVLAVGPDRPSVLDRVRTIAPELKL
ncbi:MAG TPA: urease accessory protein UreD [Ilumatobacter sp.]|nr:urease accessory protein UreD [Ilumatobacter sp.]